MIFKRFLTGGLFAAAAFAAAAGAAAQEQTQTDPGAAAREMTQNAAKPADGEMISLNVANMWTISQMSDVKLSDIQIVTTQAKFPSISPDGQKILLFAPETDAAPRKLLRWTPKTDELQELMSGQNVSMFVTWDDADNISMRQADKPFFGDSRLLKLRLENKSAALRAKKTDRRFEYFCLRRRRYHHPRPERHKNASGHFRRKRRSLLFADRFSRRKIRRFQRSDDGRAHLRRRKKCRRLYRREGHRSELFSRRPLSRLCRNFRRRQRLYVGKSHHRRFAKTFAPGARKSFERNPPARNAQQRCVFCRLRNGKRRRLSRPLGGRRITFGNEQRAMSNELEAHRCSLTAD